MALEENAPRLVLELPDELARPLADLSIEPEPPVQRLLLLQARSLDLGPPGQFLDVEGVDLLELLRDRTQSVFELFDVCPARAGEFLGGLTMSPGLLETPGKFRAIVGRLATLDRLRPLRRGLGERAEEPLALLEGGLQLEHVREMLPRLVVGVVVDGFERLLERLQQGARGVRGIDRSDGLEPLRASILEPFDFQIGDVLTGQRNQLIADQVDDPERFGLLLGPKGQTLEQQLPLQPDVRHLGLEPSPVRLYPRDGVIEPDAIRGHGLFGPGPHVL